MKLPRILPLGTVLALGAFLTPAAPAGAQVAELTVTSSAFQHEQSIPLRNSAYGDNVSPDLAWTGVPEGTQSFVLTVVDESVPMPGGFVHWLVYNIPGTATGLPEGLPAEAVVTEPAAIAGTTQGLRGMNQAGYFGPRPPAGNPPHNYVFTVYALDADLDLAEGLNRNQVMEAIEGHIVAQGSITGTYQGS